MRDILVTVIVLGVLPFVFRHAWMGVMLWTWISMMNPHRLAWGFAYDAPFAALAAGATLIALITSKDKISFPHPPPVKALIVFIVWMAITTAFAVYPGESLIQLNKILKIQLMTLVALAVLHERLHIQSFVWINVLSIGFYGVKGGIYTIATGGGGRVWGPGGFIGGNNEVGLAILVTIPLMYYLYLTTPHKWIKRGLAGAMLLSAVSVLGTQSRGAFLAIGAMSLVLWWRAPRKMLFGTALVATGVAALAIMPWSVGEKVDSITNYETDSSAMGRINAWETAVNIANDRVFGAGFEMYEKVVWAVYAPNPAEDRASDPSIVRAAHSIYFQVLGEHGWIGLILFMIVWWFVWRDAAQLRRRTRGDPELEWIFHLAGMLQVSLVGYGVGGAFLSLAYFDLPYNLLVIIVVTQRWLLRYIEERQPAAMGTGGQRLWPPPVTSGAAS
ncbi:putative O-glycosylation ligase, exosortase A system-associated [Aromatoleum sp.]|uniref:putative O-glycosylation ligase, exosortase A system-associated n=1 Tax=Aromatoleum sp. TaxID=2307007 RepID=UPI002FC7EA7F